MACLPRLCLPADQGTHGVRFPGLVELCQRLVSQLGSGAGVEVVCQLDQVLQVRRHMPASSRLSLDLAAVSKTEIIISQSLLFFFLLSLILLRLRLRLRLRLFTILYTVSREQRVLCRDE